MDGLRLHGRVLKADPKKGSFKLAWDMRATSRTVFDGFRDDVNELFRAGLLSSRVRENKSESDAMRVAEGARVFAVVFNQYVFINTVRPERDDLRQDSIVTDNRHRLEAWKYYRVLASGQRIWNNVMETKKNPPIIALGLDNPGHKSDSWSFWLMVEPSVLKYVKERTEGIPFLQVIAKRKGLMPKDSQGQTLTV